MASLYKPLASKDMNKVNGIINATRKFFKQIAVIYVIYTFIISILYPLIITTKFSYQYVFALVWILASNLFVQYFYSLTYKILLNADRKVYFVSLTQIVIIISNAILVIIISRICPDMIVVKIGSAIVFLLQPTMYRLYINKHYSIDNNVLPDIEALNQRWDGFGRKRQLNL